MSDGAAGPLRVAACQFAHGDDVDGALERARAALADARAAGAGLALLPEYWFARPGGDGDTGEGLVQRLSKDAPGVVVAGNELHEAPDGGWHNVCVVALDGAELGRQAKLRPTDREAANGVVAGDGLAAIDTPAGRVVALVCADILYPDVVADAAQLAPEILLVPVMSRARFADRTLRSRRGLFVARAFDTASVLVKAGGYTPDGRVAGRSLVAAPGGLLAIAPRAFEDATVVADVDRERMAAFRATHEGFRTGYEPTD